LTDLLSSWLFPGVVLLSNKKVKWIDIYFNVSFNLC
jgi:hypothetical protein